MYRTRQIVDLSTSEGRPLVVINGDNDKGKTSFFYAFRYVLFGKEGLKTHPKENYQSLNEWPNFFSAREGDGELSVELKIQFEDNSIKRIQRKRKFYQTNTGDEIQLDPNDQLEIFDEIGRLDVGKNIKDTENWIQKNILPYSASQFFLFDGEVIQKYTDKPSEHVLGAIKQVLGISEILNAKDDLNLLLNDLNNEQTKKTKNVNKDQKTESDIETLEGNIENAKELIDVGKKDLDAANKLIAENNKEIQKYAAIKKEKDEQIELQVQVDNAKRTMKEHNEKLKNLRCYSGLLLINPLLKIIFKTEETPPSHQQWISKVASYLLEQKIDNCVCDQPINAKIKDILESKILSLSDNPFSTLKRLVEDTYSSYRPDGKDSELNQLVNQISDLDSEIIEKESKIKGISDKILGNNDIGNDIKKRESENDDLRVKQGQLTELIHRSQGNLEMSYSKLQQLKNQVMTSTADKDLERLKKIIEYTSKIEQSFDESFFKYYETRKEDLEKYITSIFRKLTNAPEKYKGIQIGNDFDINIVRQDGTTLPSYRYSPSAGASQIAATAVIGGFNKFTTRNCPVVIDTPAGRLDPVHKENLMEFYPELNKTQVIILPQKGEIDTDELEILKNSISSIYDIVPKSDDPNQSEIRRRTND